MDRRVRPSCLCLLLALGPLLVGRSSWGDPSGLNNIPTTDVTPRNVLVLQGWGKLARGRRPRHSTGFKLGAYDGLEVGLDRILHDDPHRDVTFQAKYAFSPPLVPERWRGVVGIANVSAHRARTGDPFPYVATSYDLDVFRLHFGYTSQSDNEGFFGGMDRTVAFVGRDLQLKADAIQIHNSADTLYSVGFLYNLRRRDDGKAPPGPEALWHQLTRNIIVESWASFSSAHSDEVELTWKLNYVIPF